MALNQPIQFVSGSQMVAEQIPFSVNSRQLPRQECTSAFLPSRSGDLSSLCRSQMLRDISQIGAKFLSPRSKSEALGCSSPSQQGTGCSAMSQAMQSKFQTPPFPTRPPPTSGGPLLSEHAITSKKERPDGSPSMSFFQRLAMVGARDKAIEKEEFLSLCVRSFLHRLALSSAGVVLSALIAASPVFADEEGSRTFTITFPASHVPEVSSVQKTLVESWGIVEETYWDDSFNHQDWDAKLEQSLRETFEVASPEEAYGQIRTMLASLGDPFTRIVTPQEYRNFRISNDGALEGVGLLIASEPTTGRLLVLSPIEGGPAARAGIHQGDELVRIDGEPLRGLTGEQAATRLRGPSGTSVLLTVRRAADGALKTASAQTAELFTEEVVRLQRETITLSPVLATLLPHVDSHGHAVRTGYIRLSTFSQNAADDMAKAVTKLEGAGADSYILDLRNNPGGLVWAGLEVANMWLDGEETLVNTVDRSGELQPVHLAESRALTQHPLVVLVNGNSASASEIVAAALQDSGRALLIGDNTFGKGKIQSVFELNDGSALFVTVAKYLSPRLHQIDQVGIAPDIKCSPPILAAAAPATSMPSSRSVIVPLLPPQLKRNMKDSPSANEMASMMDVSMDPVAMELQGDACVITAERQLEADALL
eukprot:TRINITY_DN27489_c0_g1_i1.p1 TRINITY_DN27489_c0_g1~~TRINITY_DN27489_c0_g1_i1.p1  ORF type:complete len:652 (+),score=127.25 TRINITY_DN27489_c0_g1_i1:137-2092(+)